MRGGERAQRGEFDDRFNAILEENRKHDHIQGHGLEQSRTNGDRVRRDIGNEHAALLRRALPYEAFADS